MIILNYNEDPNHYIFNHLGDEGLDSTFYGIELEMIRVSPTDVVSNKIETAQTWVDNLPENKLFYLKHDGSMARGLPYHNTFGVEAVSHPFTWNWLMENIKEMDFLQSFRKKGFVSWEHNVCGMHIHVSRNSLSKSNLYKVLEFFRNNTNFICQIAGRSGRWFERYCSISKMFEVGDNRYTSVNLAAKMYHPNKYIAVRLNKQDTIEFRVFRGTLNHKGIMKNIEFVDCLISFVSTLKDSRKCKTKEYFISYVFENKGKYPNLAEYLS